MRTRKTRLLGLFVAAGLAVAACGSSGPLTPARHGPPGPSTAPGATGMTIQLTTADMVGSVLARTSAASAPQPAAADSPMPARAAAAWSQRPEAGAKSYDQQTLRMWRAWLDRLNALAKASHGGTAGSRATVFVL